MMTSTFIYGYYLGDGVAIHTHHYVEADHGLPGGPEGVHPLYSLDDDGYGLSCDICGEYIFEPEDHSDDESDDADWFKFTDEESAEFLGD